MNASTLSTTITTVRPSHLRSVEVEDECDATEETGQEISDAAALTIASWWQAPRGHGLTFARLASTGRVDLESLLDAIASEYSEAKRQGPREALHLDLLATWALNHPSRSNNA